MKEKMSRKAATDTKKTLSGLRGLIGYENES